MNEFAHPDPDLVDTLRDELARGDAQLAYAHFFRDAQKRRLARSPLNAGPATEVHLGVATTREQLSAMDRQARALLKGTDLGPEEKREQA